MAQQSLVSVFDQSHGGGAKGEESQVQKMASPDLAETFPQCTQTGENSKFQEIETIPNLSLIPNQSANFEIQL